MLLFLYSLTLRCDAASVTDLLKPYWVQGSAQWLVEQGYRAQYRLSTGNAIASIVSLSAAGFQPCVLLLVLQ